MLKAVTTLVGATCPDEMLLKFNIAGVAGFYSQLAGVLAGLAFAALIFLASARLDAARNFSPGAEGTRRHLSEVLGSAYRMLLSAFLALTLVSLGDAVLAGSSVPSGRAATEETVLAVAFSLAGAMLFYAITLTLEATETLSSNTAEGKFSASTYARDVLVVIVAPVIVTYTALGMTDYADVRYGFDHSISVVELLGIGIIVVQLVASWIAYPLYCRREREPRSPEQLSRSTTRLGWFFLATVFASVVGFGIMDAVASEDPCTTFTPFVPAAAFVATSVSLLLLTAQLAKYRSVKEEEPGPPAQEASC